MRSTTHALAVAALPALALGCGAPKKESRIARDMKIVERENAPDRLFEKGRAFHAVGDLTRAEQYYAAALNQGYPEDKALPLLLRVCVESGRYQVAIDYAEPYLRKKPREHQLRVLVGSLYSAIGDHARARASYETALVAAPDDPVSHYALAVLLRDQFHEVVSADQHFREYLRIAPEGPHAAEARDSLLKEVPAPAPSASATPMPVTAPTKVKPAPSSTPPKNPPSAASDKPTRIP
jgi:tetratricopeptide (TPR) repeat protein